MNIKMDASQAIVVEIDTQSQDAADSIANAIRAFMEIAPFSSLVRTIYNEEIEAAYDDNGIDRRAR